MSNRHRRIDCSSPWQRASFPRGFRGRCRPCAPWRTTCWEDQQQMGRSGSGTQGMGSRVRARHGPADSPVTPLPGISVAYSPSWAVPPVMLIHTKRFGCSLQFPGGHILHGQYSQQLQVITSTPTKATLPVLIFADVGGHRRSWKCKYRFPDLCLPQ